MGQKKSFAKEVRDMKQANKSKDPKQIRARARRAGGLNNLTAAERKALIRKPMEDWDIEELARGRPKDKNGHFSGPVPKWITREIHEKSIEMFKEMIRTDMRSHTVVAMDKIVEMIEDEEEDVRGKPRVPAGVKADLAKFLIEHLIGKPTQPIEADVNLKLQGILGAVLVQPDAAGNFVPSSSHQGMKEIVQAELEEDDEDDD